MRTTAVSTVYGRVLCLYGTAVSCELHQGFSMICDTEMAVVHLCSVLGTRNSRDTCRLSSSLYNTKSVYSFQIQPEPQTRILWCSAWIWMKFKSKSRNLHRKRVKSASCYGTNYMISNKIQEEMLRSWKKVGQLASKSTLFKSMYMYCTKLPREREKLRPLAIQTKYFSNQVLKFNNNKSKFYIEVQA